MRNSVKRFTEVLDSNGRTSHCPLWFRHSTKSCTVVSIAVFHSFFCDGIHAVPRIEFDDDLGVVRY